MTSDLNERALLGAATAALNARRAANGWPPTSLDKMMTADRDAWIEDVRAAITAYQAEAWQAGPVSALRQLLDHVDRETCVHEETHRGGFIWTICDQCGRKWADDEGGFVPYSDPPAVARARLVCEALPPAPKASP